MSAPKTPNLRLHIEKMLKVLIKDYFFNLQLTGMIFIHIQIHQFGVLLRFQKTTIISLVS